MRWIVVLIGAAVGLGPATQSSPKTLADVDNKYQDAVSAAEKQFGTSTANAAAERVKQLRELHEQAIANHDTAQALLLHGRMNDAENGVIESRQLSKVERQDAMNWLQHRLTGTLWHWGDDFIRFGAKGEVENSGWDHRGLATKWTVLDTRTVLLRISAGRTDNLYAILTFTADADAFAGWGFEGAPITPPNKQQLEAGK